jgi:hypothetical protein
VSKKTEKTPAPTEPEPVPAEPDMTEQHLALQRQFEEQLAKDNTAR